MSPTIQLSERRNLADELATANAELSRAQISVAHRAVRVVREAMRVRDPEAVRTVIDTLILAPSLAEQIDVAIGNDLSDEHELNVSVDAFTPDELELAVHGPFDPSQMDRMVELLTGLGWWPSKVSVRFDHIIAINVALAVDAEQARLLVQSVVGDAKGVFEHLPAG